MLNEKEIKQAEKELNKAKKVFFGMTLDEAEKYIKEKGQNFDFIRRDDYHRYIDLNWYSLCITLVANEENIINRFGANIEVYDDNGNHIGNYY